MNTLNAFIEQCQETCLHVCHAPGFPGTHSQGGTPGELIANLCDVAAMQMGDGAPKCEFEFIGSQTLVVA